MATSGSVKTNSFDGRYYQVDWKATQSTNSNQSTVSWTLKAVAGNDSWYAERTLKVVLAGGTVYSKTDRKERYAGTIASGSKVIKHDSSGDASFSISIQAAVYETSVNCTGSGSFTLNNIPRKSELSVSNGTLGTEQTLSVTRKSTSFTHTIKAVCGSASTTIATKSSSTSIKFTPPLAWASQNTTGTTVSVKYTITTYSGDSSIGSNSYTKSCAIPASVKPSCTVSVSDSTGHSETYGAPIQGVSKLAVAVSGTTAYDSPIASYSTSANGATYTVANFTTDFLKSSGTLTVKATVKDKRGRSGSTSANVSVLAYSAPTFGKLSVSRCNADGTENGMGEYCAVWFDCAITALDNKNTASYTLKYKRTSDADYTAVALNDYSGNYSVSDGSYIFEADSGSSYDVQIEAKDAFNTSARNTSVSTGFTLMHWLAGGIGMGIGKIVELKNHLDIGFRTIFRKGAVFDNDQSIYGTTQDGNDYSGLTAVTAAGNTALGWGLYNAQRGSTNIYGNTVNFHTKTGDVKFNKNQAIFNNNRRIYGINSDGERREALNPCNVSGNTILGYGNYEAADGNTNIYGYDINFGVANIATPGVYKPYIRRGDSFNVTVHTAGYVTNSGKDVCFTIPLTRPILGSPSVSVASIDGFRMRQDTKYTHGSSSSAFVKPSSMTADGQYSMGVYVKASFTDTTNVTNNSPIGIHFYGTLTFS